jgi:hypothetical protein
MNTPVLRSGRWKGSIPAWRKAEAVTSHISRWAMSTERASSSEIGQAWRSNVMSTRNPPSLE